MHRPFVAKRDRIHATFVASTTACHQHHSDRARSAKLTLVAIVTALMITSTHAFLRGLQTKNDDELILQAAPRRAAGAAFVITGVAHTVMADIRKADHHGMSTLVHTADGMVFQVDVPAGENYLGESVTWEVQHKLADNVAAATDSDNTKPEPAAAFTAANPYGCMSIH